MFSCEFPAMGESAHDFLTIAVENERGTERLAEKLAQVLAVGDVVLLDGTLGAGKTAFCRALVRAVLDDADAIVASPTFTFSQIYSAPSLTVTHFDLYRMGEAEEVYDLGWDDALDEGATLVEWPDRLGSLQPPSALSIALELDRDSETSRTFRFRGSGAWAERLAGVTP
jgi:tRNA threonylcarbamoyl adenosine modification protein YjeE